VFGHKHDWQKPEGYKGHEETQPYRNQGFVETIYFYIEQCATCGEKRKSITNRWIHIPKNDPDPEDKFSVDHSCTMVIGGLGYEKVDSK
jgi:hypothetical protein